MPCCWDMLEHRKAVDTGKADSTSDGPGNSQCTALDPECGISPYRDFYIVDADIKAILSRPGLRGGLSWQRMT